MKQLDLKPMKQLRFYTKTVYGNDLIYPADDFKAHFHALTGKKTASTAHLRALSRLGFFVEVAQPDMSLVSY